MDVKLANNTCMCKTSSSVSTLLSTRFDGLAPEGGARVLDMFMPIKNLAATVGNRAVHQMQRTRDARTVSVAN